MDLSEIKRKIRESEYYYSQHADIERAADGLTFAQSQCNFCDCDRCEERRIDYLYRHQGDYLLVPNTPVEVCLDCGMVYYDAAVLKEIERHFFAIRAHTEEPDRYVRVPEKAYA